MASSPLSSTIRPTETQFVSDLTQVFRRHKIPFGDPSDIDHLAADLASNPPFRADLFSLCTAISQMSEQNLAPGDLLELVGRAMMGTRRQSCAPATSPEVRAAFTREYEEWLGLNFTPPSGDDAPAHNGPPPWRRRPNRLSAGSAPSGVPAHSDPRPQAPQPGRRPDLSPDTPIGNLTLGELKSYLEDIELRVSRLQPFLNAVSGTSAGTSPGSPAPASQPRIATQTPGLRTIPQTAPSGRPPKPQLETQPADIEEEQQDRPVADIAEQPAGTLTPAAVQQRQLETTPAPGPSLPDLIGLTQPEPVAVPTTVAQPPATAALPEPIRYSRDAVPLPIVIEDPWPAPAQKRFSNRALIPGAAAVAVIATASVIAVRSTGHPAPIADPHVPAEMAPAPTPTNPPDRVPQTRSSLSYRPPAAIVQKPTPEREISTPSAKRAPVVSTASSNGIAAAVKPLLAEGTSGPFVPPASAGLPAKSPAVTEPPQHPAVIPSSASGSIPAAQPTVAPVQTSSPETQTAAPKPAPAQSPAPTLASTAPIVRPNMPSTVSTAVAPLPHPSELPVTVPSPTMMRYAIATPAPAYPALRKPIMDTAVMVQATIAKDGRVTNARALSGAVDMASSAVSAVEKWRFRPYLVDGNPVEVVTNVKFVFKAQR